MFSVVVAEACRGADLELVDPAGLTDSDSLRARRGGRALATRLKARAKRPRPRRGRSKPVTPRAELRRRGDRMICDARLGSPASRPESCSGERMALSGNAAAPAGGSAGAADAPLDHSDLRYVGSVHRCLAVAAALALLAGCSGTADGPEEAAEPARTTHAAEPTVEPSESEPSTEGPAVAVVEVPAQCLAATSAQTEGDPIAEAAATASLPEGVTLHLGTQVITSTHEPGDFEAVSRICSAPLTEDEHRAIATEVARAIYASGVGESLASLRVTSWVPDGETITDAGSLRVEDYGLVLWDSETANLDAMWKTRDEE